MAVTKPHGVTLKPTSGKESNDLRSAHETAGRTVRITEGDALSMIYGRVTVCTRELFMPDRTKGKEQLVMTMLHRINELRHTLANSLVAYLTDETKAFPVEVLSKQLEQIATEFRVEGMLSWSVESVLSKQ